MLSKLTQRQLLALLFAGMLFLIIASFIIEYGFGAKPCQMCWWQRYVHWALAVCAGLGLVMPPRFRWAALADCLWLAALGLGIAVWQTGGQLDLWKLPGVCSGTDAALATGTDLLASLSQAPTGPACTDWGMVIFGMSLAMWNIVAMTGVLVVATWGLWKGKK